MTRSCFIDTSFRLWDCRCSCRAMTHSQDSSPAGACPSRGGPGQHGTSVLPRDARFEVRPYTCTATSVGEIAIQPETEQGDGGNDAEIMTSVYHDDGIDEHGATVNTGPQYGEWANDQHSSVFIDHLHNITTHTCEIDGDVAHSESYVIGAMRVRDNKTVVLM